VRGIAHPFAAESLGSAVAANASGLRGSCVEDPKKISDDGAGKADP